MDSEVYRKYGDIIHLTRPVSVRHPAMAAGDRASQFAAFAALSGYDAVVQESARLTDRDAELDESERELMDRTLRQLLADGAEGIFTCFHPDDRKSGGRYVSYTGAVVRADPVSGMVTLSDGSSFLLGSLRMIEPVSGEVLYGQERQNVYGTGADVREL